jgi:SAM-dependent methyltransferase
LTIARGGTVRRLNWGCGPRPKRGWINSDRVKHPGVDVVCDIRRGLPLESESIDYAVSIHALQEIPYRHLLATLGQFRCVLKQGGVLRLGLPDFDRFVRAYLDNDPDYFLIADEYARSIGGKLIVQTFWFGRTRTPLTYDFAEELLRKAEFAHITRCAFKQTASRFPEIVQLDDREAESFFVEAVKP